MVDTKRTSRSSKKERYGNTRCRARRVSRKYISGHQNSPRNQRHGPWSLLKRGVNEIERAIEQAPQHKIVLHPTIVRGVKYRSFRAAVRARNVTRSSLVHRMQRFGRHSNRPLPRSSYAARQNMTSWLWPTSTAVTYCTIHRLWQWWHAPKDRQ